MSHNLEEKKFSLPIEEKDSAHNYLTRSDYWGTGAYDRAWKKVSDRAYRYALYHPVNDAWFTYTLDSNIHNTLGLALRIFPIDISRGWVSSCTSFRNLHWNGLLNKYNNALVRILLSYAIAWHHDSIQDMFENGFSAESMCLVIKEALTLLFDAQVPDASTPTEILETLRHNDRDDIHCGGAHACFSIAGNDSNVCWKPRTVYDDYLCHFFRTALYHALAFLKYYMPHQRYRISENLAMEEAKVGDLHYNKVVLSFAIEDHSEEHENSSDSEEDEPDPEAKREYTVPSTVNNNADTVMTSSDEQLETFVQNVMPTLTPAQLDYLAINVMSRVNLFRERAARRELRERAAATERAEAEVRARRSSARKRRVADITPRPFFSIRSFSSSEGEEGDEEKEEGE